MNKRLISSPAQSSEHGPPSHSDAYEQELIWQHYTNTIQSSKILNLDLDKIDNLVKTLNQFDEHHTPSIFLSLEPNSLESAINKILNEALKNRTTIEIVLGMR